MKRLLVVLPAALVCFALGRNSLDVSVIAAGEDPHAYFNSLVARSDHWKSFSLRSAAQLEYPANGGYAVSNSAGHWVTYSPATDTEANKQDAAKVVIPAFLAQSTTSVLALPVTSSQTTLTLVSANTAIWQNARALKIGDEIMTVVRTSGETIVNNTFTVQRGQYGTTPRNHAAGAPLAASVNSLANTVRLPIASTDGHSYVFTWDGYWTDSYMRSGLTNHKTFQLSSGRDQAWFQVNTAFNGGNKCCERAGVFNALSHVGVVDSRSLQTPGGSATWASTDGNVMGPITTASDPIQPKVGSFVVKPNTWVRYWLRLEQRANDYDYVDMWVADEDTDAVQIYRRIPVSVRTPGNAVDKFWLEFNTSTDAFTRGDSRDLVSYVRNFVVLRDTADVESLFFRPGSTTKSPSAPKNVRILR
jgi:hypothetical protein